MIGALLPASDSGCLAQDDAPAVGVFEGHTVVQPVGILRFDGLMPQTCQPDAKPGQVITVGDIEDEQIVEARRGAVTAVTVLRGFQVVAPAGQAEHHAVITIMPAEPADLAESQSLAVEADDLIQTIRRPRDANLRDIDAIGKAQWPTVDVIVPCVCHANPPLRRHSGHWRVMSDRTLRICMLRMEMKRWHHVHSRDE